MFYLDVAKGTNGFLELSKGMVLLMSPKALSRGVRCNGRARSVANIGANMLYGTQSHPCGRGK